MWSKSSRLLQRVAFRALFHSYIGIRGLNLHVKDLSQTLFIDF